MCVCESRKWCIIAYLLQLQKVGKSRAVPSELRDLLIVFSAVSTPRQSFSGKTQSWQQDSEDEVLLLPPSFLKSGHVLHTSTAAMRRGDTRILHRPDPAHQHHLDLCGFCHAC